MNQNEIENAKQNVESEKSAEKTERLTVEVPTEVKAGAMPSHCSCPPDCCT